MRPHLPAAAVLLVIAIAHASAQSATGAASGNVVLETRDLQLYPPINLELQTIGLLFPIENVGGQVQALQVRETATEMRIELPADILFDFDKADIRASAEPALKQVGDVVRQRARGTVIIEGHTDGKGSPSYNQKLSQRRAISVQKWLVEHEGLRQVRFATKGFGATRPAVPNTKPDGSDDPDGRQKNRRVEIVFGRK